MSIFLNQRVLLLLFSLLLFVLLFFFCFHIFLITYDWKRSRNDLDIWGSDFEAFSIVFLSLLAKNNLEAK